MKSLNALVPTFKAASDEKWKSGSKSSFLLLTSPENSTENISTSLLQTSASPEVSTPCEYTLAADRALIVEIHGYGM